MNALACNDPSRLCRCHNSKALRLSGDLIVQLALHVKPSGQRDAALEAIRRLLPELCDHSRCGGTQDVGHDAAP